MTQDQLQKYQQQLNEIRERLTREDTELRDEALQPQGGDETALRLMDNVDHNLADVNAALERIEKGKFGECENCGKKITAERLKALPSARYCIGCEEKKETAAAKG